MSGLVEKLCASGHKFELLASSGLCTDNQGNFCSELFDNACRKIEFPYEKLVSLEVLQETAVPTMVEFHSSLGAGRDITQQQYSQFLNSWQLIGQKYIEKETPMTMLDYLTYYNRLDTLLLGEVHENFRSNCLEHYGISVDSYVSLPSFS